MKMVKEILYEDNYLNIFTNHDNDPIKDMRIGAKTAIENWLDKMGVEDYKFTKKYTINVYNSVMISNTDLTEFPDYIKFNHIVGGFHISKNKFNNLTGCPYSITGSFMVSHNNLQNLKFGPRIIKESFGVSHNQLESLEGIAESIGKSIYLNSNNLKDLRYIPTIIEGDLNI